MKAIYESDFEELLIDILTNTLGYEYMSGANLRANYKSMNSIRSVIIEEILKESIIKINKNIKEEALNEALRKVINLESPDTIDKNKTFQSMIFAGFDIEYFYNGKEEYEHIKLIDYENKNNNSFLAVNQLSIEDKEKKRPDVIIYINGIPLIVMELKNPADEDTGIINAYRQLRNYIANDIPSLFAYNSFCIISDMVNAKAGTITSDESRFVLWKREEENKEIIKNSVNEFQYKTLVKGMLEKSHILNILRYFLFFVYDGETKSYKKILSSYHQYFAALKAVKKLKEAYLSKEKSKKAGIIWHTTGSGKSYTMLMTSKLISIALDNPTIVIITDREDLDTQLFNTFSSARDYLSQKPLKALSRENLSSLLKERNAGGIIFTTLQKFEEYDSELSKRDNIVLIVDEAHRSHYGDKAVIKKGKISYGMSKYITDALPNALKIGFTATPIEKSDKNTMAVFGDYIDIYDITQSVEDNVTVPIYYEGRVNNLRLDKNILEKIDREYEELKKETDENIIEKSKKELSNMEAILGSPETINSLSKDIIKHYEDRESILHGKAMIVAYSREIGIKIYKKILELKPDWENKIKPVMTNANDDPEEWREILGGKKTRGDLASEFKSVNSEFKIAVVVDMWLTGFDIPSLNTMYIYKHIDGHNLMQTISRVNRVYKEKEGGLIVDYIGLASRLKEAMSNYTKRDNENYGNMDIAEKAFPKFIETLDIIRGIFNNRVDYSSFLTCSNSEREYLIKKMADTIMSKEEDKKIFIDKAAELRKTETLCRSMLSDDKKIESALYEAVKIVLIKVESAQTLSLGDINKIISSMLESSVKSEGIINIFNAKEVNEVSLFDYEYLKSLSLMEHKNLALELLRKLLSDKIKSVLKTNIVKSELFSERMAILMNRYRNKQITNAEVIDELLKMSEDIISLDKESESLGLSREEKAFYDAITKFDSVKKFYEGKDDILKQLTLKLTEALRKNMTIDWTKKESARSEMRTIIKRLLKEYKYPPEDETDAVDTVIKQAELLADSEFDAA